MKNKLGMSAIISHPEKLDIDKQIELFAKTGFDSFFLSCGVTNEFYKIPFWAKKALENSIEFEAVHAPSDFVDGMWESKDSSKRFSENTKRIIEFCSEGKVEKCVLHVSTANSSPVSEVGLENFKELENYSQKLGVRLCYENSNTKEHVIAVVKNSSDFHGFCFDSGHWFCYTPEADYIKEIGNKLLYTHIHDNCGTKLIKDFSSVDLHFLPFDGEINWNEYAKSLQKLNYSGTLNLELSCYFSQEYKSQSFAEFAKTAYNRIKTLSEMI